MWSKTLTGMNTKRAEELPMSILQRSREGHRLGKMINIYGNVAVSRRFLTDISHSRKINGLLCL